MLQLTAEPILSAASELDQHIFQKGQQSLVNDLEEFVHVFETSEQFLPLDSLAMTYVELTNCGQKLKSASEKDNVQTTLDKSKVTLEQLNQLMDSVKTAQTKPRKIPFEKERQEYLALKEERRKIAEKEIQRELDHLDEYYAKLTRDSIYRNLVNGDATWKLS